MTIDLSALIAKLEAAKEGSEKLGDEVLLACGWRTVPNFDRRNSIPYWIRPSDGQNVGVNRPDPTTSIDAALTLVPDGYGWTLSSPWRNQAKVRAHCGENYVGYYDAESEMHYAGSDGATAALAICIA